MLVGAGRAVRPFATRLLISLIRTPGPERQSRASPGEAAPDLPWQGSMSGLTTYEIAAFVMLALLLGLALVLLLR